MDLRRERKRGNRLLGVLLITTVLCLGAILALLHWRLSSATAFAPQPAAGIALDARASKASAGLFSGPSEPNPSDQFSYEIKRELVFSDASRPAALRLKNPPQNRYLMVLELTLEASNEVVLRTGALPPGQMIREAALDEKLAPGDYRAVAAFWAIDAKTGAPAGQLTEPVTIVVKS